MPHAPGGDVCCHEDGKFAVAEVLECDFALLLRNVAVQNGAFLLNISAKGQFVGLLLGCRENNRAPVHATVHLNDSHESA